MARALPQRGAGGRFLPSGGGGGDTVGGIEATVSFDASQVPGGVQATNAALNSLEAKFESTANAAKKLDGASKQATGGMNSFGSRMMIVGQFADDVQYGLRAVVNQIPQAAMAFGATAGLAGGLSVAAVAANQLVNHFGDLLDLFGQSKTLTQAEQMERLAKATKLTSEETDRLARFTREQQTAKDQDQRRPKAEGEISKAVGAAIGEMGAPDLRRRLAREIAAKASQVTDQEVENVLIQDIARSRGALAGPAVTARREEIRRRMTEERAAENRQLALQQATSLLANAENGPGELGRLARIRIGELLPGAEGDIFRDPLRANREKAGLANEQRQRRATDDLNEKLARAARENKTRNDAKAKAVEDQVKEENRQAEQRGKVADQQTEEGFDHVKQLQERQRMVEEENGRQTADFFRQQGQGPALVEGRSDLDWRLRGLLTRGAERSETHSLESYEGSIAATSGESQLRKLHDIEEVLKDIKRNTEKQTILAKRIPK